MYSINIVQMIIYQIYLSIISICYDRRLWLPVFRGSSTSMGSS